MRSNKGFTLIELMVVILIVAILAAVLAPMLTGRIRESKWTEGKTGAGTIATAIRAWIAEHDGQIVADGVDISSMSGAGGFVPIGITDNDLLGKYFDVADYTVAVTSGDPPTYTIQVAGAPVGDTQGYQLDGTGAWTRF